jgi:hypothetical protein
MPPPRPLAVAYTAPTRREIRRWLEREGYVRGDALSPSDQSYAARMLGGLPTLSKLALRWLAHSWFATRTRGTARLDRRSRRYFSLPRASLGEWRTGTEWSRVGRTRWHGQGRGKPKFFDSRPRKRTRAPRTLREMNETTMNLAAWKREIARFRSD